MSGVEVSCQKAGVGIVCEADEVSLGEIYPMADVDGRDEDFSIIRMEDTDRGSL